MRNGEDAVPRLDRAMRTRRHKHLMQLLRGWRAAPPLTDAASQDGAAAVKSVERPSERRTNDYERPTTTSSNCIGPGRRSNGRGTPLKSSNRPTVR